MGSSHYVLNGLDSSKFSVILYSNRTRDKCSIYQVKIAFKHLRFARRAYFTCRKRHNPPPPGIEVLNFSFFRFILDYKYQNNLFSYKTSYIEALRETESDFRIQIFLLFLYTLHNYEQQALHTNILNVQQSEQPLFTTFESNAHAQSVICTQLFAGKLTNPN